MIQVAGSAMPAPQPSASVSAQPNPSVLAPRAAPSEAAALPSLLSLHLDPPAEQNRAPRSHPGIQNTYNCNDCRYRCNDLRNMDMHITAKHQRPHHTPDLTLLVGDSHMKTINCRAVEAGLGGAKFVCGEHIAAPLTGRRSPRAGKPGRAYNSVGSWPNAKYPESSLDKVVPKLLAQTKSPITNLVVQSPTLDLTNLNHPTLLREPAQRSSPSVCQERGADDGARPG